MGAFKTIWKLHRWLGVAAGIVLLLTAVTGVLLLVKKDYAWIQPKTMKCAEGTLADVQPLQKVIEAVLALDIPQFQSADDVSRIDFRPGKRLHKVISRHDDCEVQVDAITLQTSGPNVRRSDWLESLHDGSWFGDFAHDWVMPAVAVMLAFLAISGYVMWLYPKWKKMRRASSTRA